MTIISLSNSVMKYSETEEELKKRIDYFQKLNDKVENKKVAFVYDEHQGFYC